MVSGLRFEEGETQTGLAPHVIIGHCDVASAGVRTVLLLFLTNLAGVECHQLTIRTCNRPNAGTTKTLMQSYA